MLAFVKRVDEMIRSTRHMIVIMQLNNDTIYDKIIYWFSSREEEGIYNEMV